MFLKRWLPTFLAFPLGGLIAMETVGRLHDPASAAAGGLLVGAVVGAAQWWALRSRGVGRRWIALTAGATAAGSAVAAALTGAGTDLPDLMLAGLVSGAAVGAAQSTVLAGDRLRAAAWTAATAAGWALGWLTTWAVVGVNVERGFQVFGSSGALVATVLTGLALRAMDTRAPALGTPTVAGA
jgi:hypothetical protein